MVNEMNAMVVAFEQTQLMQPLRPTKTQPTIGAAIGLAKDSNSMPRNSVVGTFAIAAHLYTAFDPKFANADALFPIESPMRHRFHAPSNGPSLDRETIATHCANAAPEAKDPSSALWVH